MILETFGLGFGASLALALAPRCIVGVFRVHVFGQAMLKVDCHCVALSRLVLLLNVFYQIRFWLSTLQEPVGSCPSEHSTPSRGSDTLGAGDAVADVSDEASGGHCCSFVCSHSTYIIGTSKARSLVIPRIISKFFLSVTCPLHATRIDEVQHLYELSYSNDKKVLTLNERTCSKIIHSLHCIPNLRSHNIRRTIRIGW